MPIRLVLPTLSDREASARSLIAREVLNRRVPVLSAEDDAPELSLRPLTRGVAPLPVSEPHWLQFEWSGARLVVELPAAAIDALLRGILGGVVPAALSAPWREAAIARASTLLLKALGATGRGLARLEGHGPRLRGDLPHHTFALTLRYPGSGEAVYARLHVDGLGLLLAGGVVSGLPRRPPSNAWLAVAVPMQLSIGTSAVPLALLRTVVPGDVLLIAHRFADDGHRLLLNVQTPGAVKGALVRIDGNDMTVIDNVRIIMPDAIPDLREAGDSAWDDLPIRLSFDLGEKMLALHELQRLQPGETLALDRALDGCVTIRANGAVIGAGDLVEIDGRLGVSVAWLEAAAGEGAGAGGAGRARQSDDGDDGDGDGDGED